jgi:hypothetical protein
MTREEAAGHALVLGQSLARSLHDNVVGRQVLDEMADHLDHYVDEEGKSSREFQTFIETAKEYGQSFGRRQIYHNRPIPRPLCKGQTSLLVGSCSEAM